VYKDIINRFFFYLENLFREYNLSRRARTRKRSDLYITKDIVYA